MPVFGVVVLASECWSWGRGWSIQTPAHHHTITMMLFLERKYVGHPNTESLGDQLNDQNILFPLNKDFTPEQEPHLCLDLPLQGSDDIPWKSLECHKLLQ